MIRALVSLFFLTISLVFSNFLKAQCPPSTCPIGACYCIADATATEERGTLYDDGGRDNDYLDGATTGNQVNTYLFNIQPASNPDTLVLDFKSFAMETSAACEYDHIEIFDGQVSKGIFCGTNNPGIVICTSGSAMIRWLSDPNTVAAGFEMFWYTDSVPTGGPTGPTGYCKANDDPAADCGGGQGIYDVAMTGDNGGFTNKSTLVECQDNNAYSDYSASHIAYTTIGGAYQLTVYSNDNGYFLGQVSVFIDWNADFDFDDPGETIFTGSSFTGGDVAPQIIPITPPEGTSTGVKRMRIRSCSCTPPATACGTIGLGEVEDYSIVVGNPVFCAESPVPADAATDQCQKGLELFWSQNASGADPDGYKISIGTDNPPSNLVSDFDNGTDTSYVIATELMANTLYYWSVTPYNGDGDADACATWSFTTSAGDPQVDVIYARNPVDTVNSCLGNSEILFASAFGGSGNYSYEWSGANTGLLDRTDRDSAIFTGDVEEFYTYHIRVNDGDGCYGVDSVVMHTVPAANASTISGDLELCSNDQLSLSASSTVGDLRWQVKTSSADWQDISGETQSTLSSGLFQDGNSYRLIAETEFCKDTAAAVTIVVYPLSPGPGITTSTGETSFCFGEELFLISDVETNLLWNDNSTNDSLLISAPGTYSANYTDANGCVSATSSVDMVEKALPSKPIIAEAQGAELNFCEDEDASLSTTAQGILAWNADQAINTSQIDVDADGRFWVQVTDANGCSATSDTLDVFIRDLPEQPTISSASSNNSFCSGTSLDLTANSDEDVYWNGDKNVNTKTLTATTGGDYSVTAVSEFGCESTSETVAVTENPAPIRPIISSVNGKSGFCEGDSLELSATSNDPYFWNNDESINTTNFFAKTAGVVTATAKNNFDCTATSEEFQVDENPLPEQPVVTRVNGDLVSSTTTGNFQWFTDNDEEVPGETASTFENAPDGVFYVIVTDPQTGCSNRSALFTGILSYQLGDNILIYPNPVQSGEEITVVSDKALEKLFLLDAQGKRVLATKSMSINTDGIAPMVYTVLGQLGRDEVVLGKVIIK